MKAEQWQKIEQLYHAARERGANERPAFLAEACAGDEVLRREVESLLSYEAAAEDFISTPALEVAAKIIAAEHSAPLPSQINQYKIVSGIGAGGMGEVYLAEDTRLNRKVALKFLPEFFTRDKDHLRRFEQEARAVAALSHPNVCTIHEVIQTEQDRHCIVMEYVDGLTLRERMTERPMEVGEALDAAIQVASALSAAHAAGIVHRDIKTENIMLRPDGYVKVLDFGLAKLIKKESELLDTEGQTRVPGLKTLPGILMGTVAYMSPEQARGLPLDARTDIWSLGVVLYEMVTGRKPFEGQTPTDVIISIAEREPAPLSSGAPETPIALERIVAKALAKDRDQRYQTADELVLALKALKHNLEIGAEVERYKPASSRSADKTITPVGIHEGATFRRKPRGALLVASLALAVVIIVFYFLILRMPEPIADQVIKSIAVLPFKSLGADETDAYLGIGIGETLTTKLSSLKLLTVRPTNAVLKYASPEKETVVAGRELDVDAVLEGSIRRLGDTVRVTARLVSVRDGSLLWADKFDENFTDIFKVEDSISAKVAEALALKLSVEQQNRLTKRYTDNAEAYRLYLKGRYFWNKRTADGFNQGIVHFKQALEKDSNYALAYAGLADSYKGLAFYGFAAPNETMPRAKEAALHAIAIDNKLAESHASLAHVLTNYDWNWPEGEKEFKLSIELNPDYATAHQWYAIHYLTARGRWEEALQEMRRALELEPTSLVMNSFMGATLHYAGRDDEAIEQCRKTIEMDPNFAVAHWHLGLAYEQKGMFGEAIAEFQRAVTLSGGSPLMKAALGHAYAKHNKKSEAKMILDELKETSKQRYVSSYEVAAIYVALGDNEQALQLLERAFREHSFHLVFLNVWPQFSDVRSDRRFKDLVQRIGLAK